MRSISLSVTRSSFILTTPAADGRAHLGRGREAGTIRQVSPAVSQALRPSVSPVTVPHFSLLLRHSSEAVQIEHSSVRVLALKSVLFEQAETQRVRQSAAQGTSLVRSAQQACPTVVVSLKLFILCMIYDTYNLRPLHVPR